MRILFVDASRNGWGTEQHLLALSRALVGDAHDVSAVVRKDSPVANMMRGHGVRTYETAFRGGADPRGLACLLRVIRAEQPEWMVTNRGKLYWTLWAMGRLCGVRVALFRHLPERQRWLTRRVLPRLVDRFFVVSEFARRHLVAQGAPRDRVSVLYNPVDVEGLQSSVAGRRGSRARLGFASDDFVIGFVGRVERDKGVRVLWQAVLPLLSPAARVRFLCVGNGAEREALRGEAAQAGVSSFCRFIDWTENVGEYYAAMDLLVAPSIALETFCRVVAEAQASELPVIGTEIGGIPEAMTPNRSGLLVRPQDAGALQRAIIRFHDDPPLRARFSANGLRFVRRHFDARKIGMQFAAALADPVPETVPPSLAGRS